VLSREQIATLMSEHNEEALLADGFEEAFIGPAVRCGQPTLAAYSYSKAVEVLVKRDGITEEEAQEYIDFNVTGAWVGPNTPIFVIDLQDDWV
jgi:hypothetical protein